MSGKNKKLDVGALVKSLREYRVWVAERDGDYGSYERPRWALDLAEMIDDASIEEPGCDCTEET